MKNYSEPHFPLKKRYIHLGLQIPRSLRNDYNLPKVVSQFLFLFSYRKLNSIDTHMIAMLVPQVATASFPSVMSTAKAALKKMNKSLESDLQVSIFVDLILENINEDVPKVSYTLFSTMNSSS